jgi:CHAT domain/Lecithin:cholesterol acyltransferase
MDKVRDTVTLAVGADASVTEDIAGWSSEVFSLSNAARGAPTSLQTLQLEKDAVVELELQNGTRLLVAADEAERYLGAPIGRGVGQPGMISVGPVLRLSGSHLPSGIAREGLGAWVLKSLRVYRAGPSGMTALAAAGSFQDSQLVHGPGLFRCATDQWALSQVDALPATSEPALLFIHGTASSTEGSFKGLWSEPYLVKLSALYGGRIYGLEHRSMTESPVANALDAVKLLPKGARLHLVSHSRGGMVGELLARANRLNSLPFTSAEISRFLDYAKQTGRKGVEADADRLKELAAQMKARDIRIERFVRVACPARGTTLASGRLDRWASVMLNLFGKGLDIAGKSVPVMVPVAKAYDLLQNFLLAVVKERTDARILPGLEAMMPDSPLVALLNAPDVEIEQPLHVLAGDFEGDGLLSWLSDCLSEAFYGGQTDLVVNTPSMTGGGARRQGIWQKSLSGPEVTHFSYFRRDESALPLLEALAGESASFELVSGPSTAVISRGGRKPIPRPDAPIVFLLPGIMGSHIQIGNDRIWFDPINLIAGEMDRLTVNARNVTPDGWMDLSYQKLADYLSDSHEVRPFAYDWRLSIVAAADKFGAQLDQAMQDAEKRRKPVRIVAHSMGGLVARLALKDRWEKFKALSGSRLLQLGTPNRGSHSMAAVLLGRDDFVQMIARWLDWKHDMRDFLGIVRDFPGVLELLPWPVENGPAIDGVDYFSARTWQDWSVKDPVANEGKGWQAPQDTPLSAARNAIAVLQATELDPDCTLYVAGHGETPVGVRFSDGQLEIGVTDEGDGRVAWKTGIPPGVRAWYTDAAHGDLAKHESAFAAYLELLDSGSTRLLAESPPSARGISVVTYHPRAFEAHTLYPSEAEVLAAAMGGARPGRARVTKAPPAVIDVTHGSLATSDAPVMIGAYANDSLRGSAQFLDRHLGNRMRQAYDLGRYPSFPGEAAVFFHPKPNHRPAGAIVVGLGGVGELLPGELTRSLVGGLLEYARIGVQQAGSGSGAIEPLALEVASLLVGTGFTGLTVEVGTRCLADAVRRANAKLEQSHMPVRIARLSIFEEVESRAISVVESLRELVRETQFSGAISVSGLLQSGEGGYQGRCAASGGQTGWDRVHITTDEDGALRFTVVTDRARNVVSEEPSQRQAVEGMISAATNSTTDQPGLSRALFELLVPNGMKEMVAELSGLILGVDIPAAAFPWESMRETDGASEDPLATRIGLVRQLASPHGRSRVPTAANKSIFIVGDTDSGFNELPGAQQEARMVAATFVQAGYSHNENFLRPAAQEVFAHLFDGRYQFMHFAGHGVVGLKIGSESYTGMVLGENTFLTTAQISKLRWVPEFVFINCCHLGSMAEDSKPRWGELAANLATEFIEMGCKAVIAAGWAVDDGAASTFARAFYAAMFEGERFGEAVRRARAETYKSSPATNTWGAFQAYGDERYQFLVMTQDWQAPDYVHVSQLIADLDLLNARLKGKADDELAMYEKQLTSIEGAARARYYENAEVREKFAVAWAELDDKARAIDHYRAALVQADAKSSLHGLEQLANLEIRYGAELLGGKAVRYRADGEKIMQTGLERLQLLLQLGPTVERLSLRGSYFKHRAQALRATKREEGVSEALVEMQKAYWDAATESLRQTGSWDYYPLLNALDGACLGAAWGVKGPLNERGAQLRELLDAAAENGRRRFALNREFFHAVAEVDAQRVDALWACFDDRTSACITRPEVVETLLDRYCDLLTRLGSARERDSLTNQPIFLMAMLPDDEKGKSIKGALKKLKDGIEQCAGGKD